LSGRAAWALVVGARRSGETIRVVDLVGEQAVDFLVYSAADKAERYDAQLTLLTHGSTAITRGTQLLSNRGYELMTVASDTLGAHDTLVGCCSAEANTVRFGERAAHLHSCRDNFLIELAKHGMSKRDIVPNLNFSCRFRSRRMAGWPLSPACTSRATTSICSPASTSSFPTARRSTIRATDLTPRRSRSRFRAHDSRANHYAACGGRPIGLISAMNFAQARMRGD
jgi:hypothetical protein